MPARYTERLLFVLTTAFGCHIALHPTPAAVFALGTTIGALTLRGVVRGWSRAKAARLEALQSDLGALQERVKALGLDLDRVKTQAQAVDNRTRLPGSR